MSVKPFGSLTPAGKRCRIARDVLKQLDAKRLIAEHNVYVAVKETEDRKAPWRPDYHSHIHGFLQFTEAADLTLSEAKQCKVCAMGSLLMAKLNFKNGVKFGEAVSSRTSVVEQLNDFFSPQQLDAIESVFEGRSYGGETSSDDYYNHRIGAKYSHADAEEVLRDIMHNIIKHNGEFKFTNTRTPAPTKARNQYSKKVTT